MTMSTVYRKESEPLRDRKYNQQSGWQQMLQEDTAASLQHRTNCLIAFTVIAILIASAALALSICLLLEAFEEGGRESELATQLQQRVKLLEDQVLDQRSQNTIAGTEPGMMEPRMTKLNIPTVAKEEPPAEPPLPASPHDHHDHHGHHDHHDSPSTKGLSDDADYGNGYDHDVLPNPGVPFDDDDVNWWEGSGADSFTADCPDNPARPTCPIGFVLCKTKEACPSFVCCKTD